MQYRPLGRTGLDVSIVSLGTGGQSRLGRATHGDDEQSKRVVRRALDLGVNLFDTAPGYMGTEELLGNALKGVPRSSYMVTTKAPAVGRRGGVVGPEEIIGSCEESCRQLDSDYVDGLQFHNVRAEDYNDLVERLYPVAARLKAEGKVRFIGLTEMMEGRNQTDPSRGGDPAHHMAARAAADGLWDTVSLKYGILNQVAEREVFPAATAHGVGVLNMSSIRMKLVRPADLEALIVDWKQRGLLEPDALPDRDPLGFLVHGAVPSVIAAAYKFAVEPEAVSSVVIGTGNPDHLEENVSAVLAGPLPHQDSARLRALFGLIVEGV